MTASAPQRIQRRARVVGRCRWPLGALLVCWALAWYVGARQQWASQTWLWFAAAGYPIGGALILVCLLTSYWREKAERAQLDAALHQPSTAPDERSMSNPQSADVAAPWLSMVGVPASRVPAICVPGVCVPAICVPEVCVPEVAAPLSIPPLVTPPVTPSLGIPQVTPQTSRPHSAPGDAHPSIHSTTPREGHR